MKSNKLYVNISKSDYLIFRPSRRKLRLNLTLKYDGQTLVQKRHVKFLGVYFDENLSWKIHINYILVKNIKICWNNPLSLLISLNIGYKTCLIL